MSKNIENYLECILIELQKLEEGRFTGNVVFQVNWKDGEIANCNIGLNKSVKLDKYIG